MSERDIDQEALLCALVLVPNTFARNRFYDLFAAPWARRIRARAAELRTIVRQVSANQRNVVLRELSVHASGHGVLRYAVPELALERTSMLDPLEVAVLRFAVSRKGKKSPDEVEQALRVTEEDRRQVETALVKLGQRLELPSLADVPAPALETTFVSGDN